MVFKNHMAIDHGFKQTTMKCQGEAHTLASIVMHMSFKIFSVLFDVYPCMRRLSQALKIKRKT